MAYLIFALVPVVMLLLLAMPRLEAWCMEASAEAEPAGPGGVVGAAAPTGPMGGAIGQIGQIGQIGPGGPMVELPAEAV